MASLDAMGLVKGRRGGKARSPEALSYTLTLPISSPLSLQLEAQAEAEKRNIGQADYIHKEYDHIKKVKEDQEKHRIEINKCALPHCS